MLAQIDQWSVNTYQKPFKRRLGGSILGNPCMQYLWLTFRWCKADIKPGRIYRLLDRGNREETYTFKILEGVGFKLYTHDPKTNEQYSMSLLGGHCGGSLDAIAHLPTSYDISEPVLISIKTAGAGARFNKIIENGVKLTAPEYYDQECFYGYGYGIEYAAWFITGKNDDNIHFEVEKLDLKRGEQLFEKAKIVIMSQVPLEKISLSPASKECTHCDMKGICHKGVSPDINCRSCQNASPLFETKNDNDKPAWYCGYHQDLIPDDFIKQGCEHYKPIVNGN